MSRERIMRIIKDIDRFFVDMENANVKDIQALKNTEKFYALSMMLFSVINRAIDLGEEIVSDKKLGFPEKYREIFSLLERRNIIDSEMYSKFSDLIHFRNLAAHEYQDIAKEDIFEAFKKIIIVKKFVEIAKKLY